MAKSAQAFRTIREVADWLDVAAHVLRFWESKFNQIKPVKRAGGRRYYRPADMELVGGIKVLLHDRGLTIRGVQKMISDEGVEAVTSLSPPIDDILGEDAAAYRDSRPEPQGDIVDHEPLPDPEPQPTPTPAPAAPPAPATSPEQTEAAAEFLADAAADLAEQDNDDAQIQPAAVAPAPPSPEPEPQPEPAPSTPAPVPAASPPAPEPEPTPDPTPIAAEAPAPAPQPTPAPPRPSWDPAEGILGQLVVVGAATAPGSRAHWPNQIAALRALSARIARPPHAR